MLQIGLGSRHIHVWVRRSGWGIIKQNATSWVGIQFQSFLLIVLTLISSDPHLTASPSEPRRCVCEYIQGARTEPLRQSTRMLEGSMGDRFSVGWCSSNLVCFVLRVWVMSRLRWEVASRTLIGVSGNIFLSCAIVLTNILVTGTLVARIPHAVV
jgi:hypothetical protein